MELNNPKPDNKEFFWYLPDNDIARVFLGMYDVNATFEMPLLYGALPDMEDDEDVEKLIWPVSVEEWWARSNLKGPPDLEVESPRLYVGPYRNEKAAELAEEIAHKAYEAFEELWDAVGRAQGGVIEMDLSKPSYTKFSAKPLPQGVDMSLRWIEFDLSPRPKLQSPKLQVIDGGQSKEPKAE